MDAKFTCPFCLNEHESPNGTGSDVQCCGEVGEVWTEQEYLDQCEAAWMREQEKYAT